MGDIGSLLQTILIFLIVLWVFTVAVGWMIFQKAGQPGWAVLVPIYNYYVGVVNICRMEVIWFVLLFVPFLGIITALMIPFKLAEKFGKGGGFGIGLLLLPIIFYPILAFGPAEYQDGSRKKRSLYDDDDDDDRPKRGRTSW